MEMESSHMSGDLEMSGMTPTQKYYQLNRDKIKARIAERERNLHKDGLHTIRGKNGVTTLIYKWSEPIDLTTQIMYKSRLKYELRGLFNGDYILVVDEVDAQLMYTHREDELIKNKFSTFFENILA